MVDRPEGSVRKQHRDAWVPRAATNAIESRQIAHATGQECHAPTPCQSRVWPGEKGFTTLPPKSSANFCDRAPPARSQSRSVPATGCWRRHCRFTRSTPAAGRRGTQGRLPGHRSVDDDVDVCIDLGLPTDFAMVVHDADRDGSQGYIDSGEVGHSSSPSQWIYESRKRTPQVNQPARSPMLVADCSPSQSGCERVSLAGTCPTPRRYVPALAMLSASHLSTTFGTARSPCLEGTCIRMAAL